MITLPQPRINSDIYVNICFGCSKAPSHRDGSLEYQKHMFWLIKKKIIFNYALLSRGLVMKPNVYLTICGGWKMIISDGQAWNTQLFHDKFNSLHTGIFSMLLSIADFFQRIISQILSECQMVWIQIRTNVLSVLIWIETSADDKSCCKQAKSSHIYWSPGTFVSKFN